MPLLQQMVARHFRNKLPYIVEKNLSRLTSQWEESIRAAMTQILNDAERRLNELVETVARLIATSPATVPQMQSDLQLIDSLLKTVQHQVRPYE
ncbi:MAG TPA: hypothetical protein VGQ39_14055 [Pyrinomonadaceae bacterium]|jgi:phage shock protein A|nr:hypothetical protein [Pyrinomonadaceae bacterium]